MVEDHESRIKGRPVFAKTRRTEVQDETLTPPLFKASIDLVTKDVLASFAVWGTGDTSVIIMDQATPQEVIVDDRNQQTREDMHRVFDYYINLIISGGPFEELS